MKFYLCLNFISLHCLKNSKLQMKLVLFIDALCACLIPKTSPNTASVQTTSSNKGEWRRINHYTTDFLM